MTDGFDLPGFARVDAPELDGTLYFGSFFPGDLDHWLYLNALTPSMNRGQIFPGRFEVEFVKILCADVDHVRKNPKTIKVRIVSGLPVYEKDDD